MSRTSLATPAARFAAAATAVIGAIAITGMALSAHPAAAAASAAPSGPPRYYADVENGNEVVIRATATGHVTGDYYDRDGGIGALAAASDNRFYFVEDLGSTASATVKTFRITTAGQITGLASVRGATISTPGGVVDSLAVSPNGSELAAGEFFDPSPIGGGGPVAGLVVLNLRTGKRTFWQGIDKKNWPVSIPSVSWTADGRSVVYLLKWCSKGLEGTDTCMSQSRQDQQVWTLNAASHGGSLAAHGHLLLASSARYPVIQQALASVRAGAVIVMALSGKEDAHLAIDLVSVPAGQTQTVLYSGAAGEAAGSSLSADSSQAYLLLADGFGAHHGWIHDGLLHLLPPTNGDGEPMAW